MIRVSSFCATLLAGAALCAPSAQAQDAVDPFELSPEQLFDATVVSVSRESENVWEAPAAVFVITSSDIERSGATSIAEALRLAPGVQVARISTSGWAVSVRGFNSPLTNKLLVLIDGREIYDPLFSGVYWDVQDTALEDIERIEVIRGPGASLWGANAVNGVINIITKDAASTQGALVSVIAGNTERGSITARYGGALGENAHWRVYGRAFEREGQERVIGGDDNSGWRAWRGGFRADFAMSPADNITLQGDLYRSETGQYRSVPQLTPPFAVTTAESINAEGANVLGRWTRDLDSDASLIVQAYVDVTRRNQLTLKDTRTTFDLDIQYDFPTLGQHDLITGFRYRNTSDRITETSIITSDARTHSEELFSAFVQDQIGFGPWRLTLGSKFDNNDYSGFEVQPNARLQWSDEQQMAWASVSRAVRSPSELEREFNVVTGVIPLDILVPPGIIVTVPVSVELAPNDEFDSEEVIAYEVGYRRRLGANVELDIAAFYNDYDELSALTLLPSQLEFTPVVHFVQPIVAANSTEAQTYGIETVLNWRAQDNLNVALSYTFLEMELEGPPPSVAIAAEVAEEQSPRNQASVRVQWDLSDRLALDGALYYVDELPAYDLDSYVRADLRLAYRLTDRLQVELIGQGLFDEQRREFGSAGDANAASIERSIFGRLTWRQ
jgi:iron complex outermembrane recepter protein